MTKKEENLGIGEFCEETSMHGVKYLNSPGYFRKFFWCVLLICATCLLVRQIRQQMLQLRDSPVSTNVRLVYESRLQFPSITICNGNQMRITEIAKYDAYSTMTKMNRIVLNSDTLDDYLSRDFALFARNHFDLNMNDSKVLSNLKIIDPENLKELQTLDENFGDSSNFALNVSHQQEDMIISCFTNLGEPCIVRKLMNDFGVCYAINYNTSRISSAKIPGFSEKFLISLNVENYQNIPGKFPYAGFKLLLHEDNEWPLVDSRGLNIPAARVTMLALKRKEAQLLPISDYGKHGSCIKPYPLEYFPQSQFNFDTCLQDNQFRMIARACKCTPIMVPTAGGILWDQFPWMRDLQNERSSCYESCNRGYYDAIITQLTLGESFMEQLSPETVKGIKKTFEQSMEAKARHNPKEVEEDQTLINNTFLSLEALKQWNIAPFPPENYSDTKQQVMDVHACYSRLVDHEIIKTFVEILSDARNDEDISLISESNHKSNAYKDSFLKMLMPNDQVLTLMQAKNISNISETSQIVENHFLSLVSFFGDLSQLDGVVQEFSIDHTRFENAINDIFMYSAINITKKEWAHRHITKSIGLGSDYRTSVADPLIKNIRSLQSLIETTVEYNYNNLSEYMGASESFWRYIHYTLVMSHPKRLIPLVDKDGTCTVKIMQDLMNLYDELALNNTFVEGFASPECSLTEWSSITQWNNFDIRSIIMDTYVCLHSSNQTLTTLRQNLTEATSPITANMSLMDDKLSKYYDKFTHDQHIYTDNLAQVAVYYRDMTREVLVQQNTYDIWGLFCDIGGTLGLFLGASAMTFCEFLDWICMKVISCKNFVKVKASKEDKKGAKSNVDHAGSSEILQLKHTEETVPKESGNL